jgi:integrase
MAWAEKISSSGRWRGRYRDATGEVQTVADGPFSRKSDAVRAAASAEDDSRRRPGQLVKANKLTWSAWVEIWWPKRDVEPGTLHRDLSRRQRHLDPRWGSERIDTISRDAVQDWVDELKSSNLAPATVARCYHLLSASMSAAVLAKRITASPCVSINLPPLPPADERYLTWDEVEAVAHFMPPQDALLVWLMVGTGIRWGEAAGLHRHRLHLDQGRLDVHEVWDQRMRQVKPYPKGRTKRSVPLPDWLSVKLEEHLRELPATSSCRSPHRAPSRCRSSLVVPGRGGVVLDYDSWHRGAWGRSVGQSLWFGVGAKGDDANRGFRLEQEARRKFGPDVAVERRWQPGLSGVGEVTIHDLRHTYASWLLQSRKVSIEQLSELLGHKSIATTQRYAHLADTQWEGVVAALNEKSAPLLPHNDHESLQHDQNVTPIRRSN